MYKPLEVKVNRGVMGLQDGPKTPEEVGCLVEEEGELFCTEKHKYSELSKSWIGLGFFFFLPESKNTKSLKDLLL